MVDDFVISPSQGAQLLSLAALIKAGDIVLMGERGDKLAAEALIADISQEIALQVGDNG